jgi:hypothetical protein
MKRVISVTLLIVCILTFKGLSTNSSVAAQQDTITAPEAVSVAESQDFATRQLKDPWDMSEFSDISRYLNTSGQRDTVKNVLVQDGVFSGTSVGDITTGKNGYFFVQHPGYYDTIPVGKDGALYPINSSTYHCMYIAMKVNSLASNGFGPDQFQIFWFADGRLNTNGGTYGRSGGIQIYPETVSGQPVHIWKLFKIDLGALSAQGGGTVAWNQASSWQGLRIDPTVNANIDFAVDWVRLTSCSSNLQTVTWTPNAALKYLWIRPANTTRYIRVATDLVGSSGSYSLNIDGIAPGTYYYGLSSSISSCCTVENSTPLVINQTPSAKFSRPSFTSGADYATQAGNPWDFSDAADVSEFRNIAAHSFQNGVLDITTSAGSLPGGVDANIFLNLPSTVNATEYRYFSFRMYTERPWEDFANGTIVRLVWTIPSLTGQPGYECHLVGQDIPYDVGWQTYSVDLFKAYDGSVEQTSPSGPPHCPSLPTSWSSRPNVIKIRFDPNENITSSALHQQLDWVTLTKMDRASIGSNYPIQVQFNKPLTQLKSFTLYYTDNKANPTQHLISQEQLPLSVLSITSDETLLASPQDVDAQYKVFLPMILKDYPKIQAIGTNGISYLWNTSSVAAGQYYICTEVDDGINRATYCSDAPVQIVSP